DLGVTLGVNPVSSSPGIRTLTGGALPFGSESNTIGRTMTAASTSAIAPTNRRRPRRCSVLTSWSSAIGAGNGEKGAEHDDFIILSRCASGGGERFGHACVFEEPVLNFFFQKYFPQVGRSGPPGSRQRRQMPTRDARRHCTHHAGNILVLEHAEYGNRLRRESTGAE